MATLASSLPRPLHSTHVPPPETHNASLARKPHSSAPVGDQQQQQLVSKPKIPPYGQRKGWRPRNPEDFGDGGAYPECHLAQYPLGLGKKGVSNSGNTLSLQVDASGNVSYDAIAMHGHREGRVVQTSFKDLVPLAKREGVTEKETAMQRPGEDEVAETTERTKLALEKLVQGKIKAAQPKNVPTTDSKSQYLRYTPGQPSLSSDNPLSSQSSSAPQRIIKMTNAVEDPLEPPRFKHKKIPRGPPSPPAPVMRSPPRKVTAKEQKEWMIPPCVSNWKNNKGFTIALDKRLAADGRGLQDVHINDRFAQFSESLHIADRHAREEVRQRSLMQQRIAQKEKEAKEENLRMLAMKAREERSGAGASRLEAGEISSRRIDDAPTVAGSSKPSGPLVGGYGSDSEEESDAGSDAGNRVGRRGGGNEDEEDVAARERDELRQERRRDREREMRMSNMGTEQRARVLARAQNRDISEKIALGLAKPTMSKDSMLDSRLFNQESYSASFADDDAYHLYDRPLFTGSNAAAAIYKPRGNVNDDGEALGGGNEEGIDRALKNDRFNLGVAGAGKGFEGADSQEVKEGPVQFETADPFGVDAFLEDAKRGAKRGLDTSGEGGSRKRVKE